jgi:cytochrome bd-type quinol oxidase subunit 2
VLPALFAWQLFGLLRRLPWVRHGWFRGLLISASILIWLLSAVYILAYVASKSRDAIAAEIMEPSERATRVTLHPVTILSVCAVCGIMVWFARRIESTPEFPLGLLIGEVTVLLTALLNCLVLVYGGHESWQTLVVLVFLAHLPIAVAEGLILGFALGFLARVKPDVLGWNVLEKGPCALE